MFVPQGLREPVDGQSSGMLGTLVPSTDIRKKKRILRDVWQVDAWGKAHLKIWKQPHRLNKQKVHCSCPMCTSKVSNLGWKHSEKQHLAQGWDTTPVDDSLIWKSQQEKDKVVYSTKTEYDEELNPYGIQVPFITKVAV